MSEHELPVGKNFLQHAPIGEHPAGFHPSQFWDSQQQSQVAKNLYGRWLRPGDTAFDVGANVGQRTAWFLELGAKVVAVEPIGPLLEHVDPSAVRVNAACGASNGQQPFWICQSSTYLSTLSLDYMSKVYESPGIGGNVYTESTTEVVTLDSLIDRHGVPSFTKIDVEGGELEVFAGLSQPLPALSFEVHQFDPAKAHACIAALDGLGRYHYEYSRLETFLIEPWPPRGDWAVFGDIYAVLQDSSAGSASPL